jgi:hypothetical protein
MFRTVTAAVLTLTVVAPAFADEGTAAVPPPSIRVSGKVSAGLSRPSALPMLYASYAALQAYDVYSTKEGLSRGAQEANPLMQGVVGNTGTFIAVKAAVGVATIVAAERLWKTNKPAAIAVMIASNSVAAFVAAKNARTLRQLR